MTYIRYTPEEIERANDVSLTAVADCLGYSVKRVGRLYTLKEVDSLRIYDDRTWYRFSDKTVTKRGGTAINFMMEFSGLEFGEAVSWLLEYRGESKELIQAYKPEHKKDDTIKEFMLPQPNKDNRRMFAYLHKKRGISIEAINHCFAQGIMYESAEYHNVVFVGRDIEGRARFASMRGTSGDFKGDVVNNDKTYGVNLYREGSNRLVVVEGAIDMLSYLDLEQDYTSSLLTLGMVSFAPLDTFLSEHPDIETIVPALDNDEAGRKATQELRTKYRGRGYKVQEYSFPEKYNDLNVVLKARRSRERARSKVI